MQMQWNISNGWNSSMAIMMKSNLMRLKIIYFSFFFFRLMYF